MRFDEIFFLIPDTEITWICQARWRRGWTTQRFAWWDWGFGWEASTGSRNWNIRWFCNRKSKYLKLLFGFKILWNLISRVFSCIYFTVARKFKKKLKKWDLFHEFFLDIIFPFVKNFIEKIQQQQKKWNFTSFFALDFF